MTSNISTNTCFVDNGEKFCEKFWKKFGKKFSTSEQEQSFYTSDIDPDQKSKELYEYHKELWNIQRKKLDLQNKVPEIIKDPQYVNGAYELATQNPNLRLGSDSIISIYWHWNSMQDIIKEDNNWLRKTFKDFNISETDKEERKFNNNWSDLKKFVWGYLQKANTIGGFVVFPKHLNSINGRRGMSAKICDRFDLTLECIRRFYNEPKRDNPLIDALTADHKFFQIFGSFEKYIDFFCLNSWVKDGVLSLIDNEPLDNWDFNNDKSLPTKSNWQTFYKNIMDRLKDRNTDIQNLFVEKK